MRILHEKLHLQHHKHTGRLLHHKHTSYRGLAVVFVLAGFTMIGLNMLARVAADSYMSVGAMVAAPIPKTAPVISTAPSGTVTTSSVQISGSCPLVSPQPVVLVMVNGKPAGSSICDSNNDFSLPISLAPGVQQLSASTQTITGGVGPASTPVEFMYSPKGAQGASGPQITTDASYAYLGADENGAWSGTVSGGNAPYYLHVDWGDGTQNTYKPTAGPQQYNHKYGKVQSYNAAFYLTDATGVSTTLQYAVAAYTTATPVAAAVASNDTPLVTPQIAGLYGLFVTVLAICGIIYLEAKHAHKHPVAMAGMS